MCGAPLSARGNVDWMRKLAFRYRRIRDIYAANCTNVVGNILVIIIIIIFLPLVGVPEGDKKLMSIIIRAVERLIFLIALIARLIILITR